MRRRFGQEAATYLAEPLLAGIHAGDVDRLSVRALFPRFRDAERKHGSLLRAFRSSPQSRSPNPDGVFRSLPGGLSEMVRALEHALPPGSIRLNTTVTRILARQSADGATAGALYPMPSALGPSAFRIEASGSEPFEARALVLATPAYVTAALVRGRDPALAALCDEVPYASSATIALAFPRESVTHPLNGSGYVVPRVENTGILAASWLSSKWPHRAPEGHVLLRTFVGGARDPRALERSDAELVALSMAAVRPVLGIRGEPLFSHIYRWERASAQHEVGHVERLAAIERALAGHPGLFVTGSGFRGVGIPDCVADGRATARSVATWITAQPS